MKRVIYLLAFASLFAACSSDDDNTQKGIPFNETEKEIAANSPAFAIKLMKALDATLEDNNSYVVSPLGASMALSMAMNGAQGETYDQIAEALSLSDYPLDEINRYNNKLLTGLAALDNQAQIGIANSLWLNEGVNTLAPYNYCIAQHYNATNETLDFADESSLARINSWVEEYTNYLIPQYTDYIDEDAKLMFLNSSYFNSPWNIEFDKEQSFVEKFYAYDGTEQETEYWMIDGVLNFMYHCTYGSDRIETLSLFVGKDETYCVDFILPHCYIPNFYNSDFTYETFMEYLDNGGLKQIYDSIDHYRFEQPAKAVSHKAGLLGDALPAPRIVFPKLKMEFKAELNDAFKAMGITDAFDEEKADFGLLSDSEVNISKIQQANVFSIDENGTSTGSNSENNNTTRTIASWNIFFNRPFLFFVREVKTNTILFAGKVAKM